MAQRLTSWVLWQLNTLTGYQPPLRLPYSTSQADPNDQPTWPATCTSGIILLPLEVIGEILKYLDWKDLSNASLADRTWYRATHSRQLWYAMVKDLQLACGIGRLEEPMGDYTVAELRRWIVRRLRIQETWSPASTTTVTFKARKFNHSDVRFAKLLPGGRWLLANDYDGKLFYYDLESTQLEKRLLVDPGLGDNTTKPDRLNRFDLWIDQSKSKLALRVALWSTGGGIEVTRTCIYQVDLTGHGETAYLVVKPLSVVRDDMETAKWAVGLSEKYLVDCRIVNLSNLRLSLVQYRTDDPESKRISVPYPISRASKVYITTSDLVIVVDLNCIDIYAIRQLEEYADNGPEENQREISPLHHIVCPVALKHTSTPFVFQGYTWLIFSHQDQIHLTRIPYEEEGDFKTISLGEYPIGRRDRSVLFFGPTYTIRVRPDYTADVVTYSWDAEMNVTTFTTRPITMPTLENHFGRLQPAGLVGEIGRIIFQSPKDNQCIVLDPVL